MQNIAILLQNIFASCLQFFYCFLLFFFVLFCVRLFFLLFLCCKICLQHFIISVFAVYLCKYDLIILFTLAFRISQYYCKMFLRVVYYKLFFLLLLYCFSLFCSVLFCVCLFFFFILLHNMSTKVYIFFAVYPCKYDLIILFKLE